MADESKKPKRSFVASVIPAADSSAAVYVYVRTDEWAAAADDRDTSMKTPSAVPTDAPYGNEVLELFVHVKVLATKELNWIAIPEP